MLYRKNVTSHELPLAGGSTPQRGVLGFGSLAPLMEGETRGTRVGECLGACFFSTLQIKL